MPTTGRQILLGLLVIAALIGAVLSAAWLPQRDAEAIGAPPTVNSLANDDDGVCSGAPNKLAVGDCTFHEAIDRLNVGGADKIEFAVSGTIDLTTGAGALPAFTLANVTIDSTGRTIQLDGGGAVTDALVFTPTIVGSDFTLMGDPTTPFEIVDFTIDAVHISPATSVGELSFDNIRTSQIGEDGVDINVPNALAVNVEDSNIQANDDGVRSTFTGVGGDQPENAVVTVRRNTIVGDVDSSADGHGVRFDFEGELNVPAGGGTANANSVTISDNVQLSGGNFDSGVNVSYCNLGGCEAIDSTFDVNINNNTYVTGVEVDLNADPGTAVSELNTFTVHVDGNGAITGPNADAVSVDIGIGDGTGSNIVATTVDDNGDITGGTSSDGVEIDVSLCCGSDHVATVSVSGNGDITGDEDGVHVRVEAGAYGSIESGNHNTASISIEDNGELIGTNSQGVDADANAGSDLTEANDNIATVDVNGNGDITGDGPGVAAEADAGSDDTADHNTALISVSDNGDITSTTSGDAVSADAGAGGDLDSDLNDARIEVNGNGDITGMNDAIEAETFAGASTSADADVNVSRVSIIGNGVLEGLAGEAIETEALAGSDLPSSVANETSILIAENDALFGTTGGAFIAADVCCNPAATNRIDVADNGSINGTGVGAHGLEIQLNSSSAVASSNTVNIVDTTLPQQTIEGAEDGINLFAESASETLLVVAGNNIEDSVGDGIDLCCGSFAGSEIEDNLITDNGGAGVTAANMSGLWIHHNEITGNGASGVSVTGSADAITISENEMRDNVGLGIDLVPTLGFGCQVPFPAPNDCIPFPTITSATATHANGTACSGCTVEIFVADATPADQADPALVQHGEGAVFLASDAASAGGAFSIALPCGLAAGDLTATATDALGNTSEFAANVAFAGTSCDTDGDGLSNPFEQGFGGGGIVIVNPETGNTATGTGSAAGGSTITSGSVSVTFPPGTTADGTIVITFVPGPNPALSIMGAVLPPGATKSVTMPIGKGGSICLNDSPNATIENTQGGGCAPPPNNPAHCPHNKVRIDVPASIGAFNTTTTRTPSPECAPATYVLTRTGVSQISISGLHHTAIATCGHPNAHVPSSIRSCPQARGQR